MEVVQTFLRGRGGRLSWRLLIKCQSMWTGDCWLSPDSNRYAAEQQARDQDSDYKWQNRFNNLVNEFRTPRQDVIKLLGLLHPVDNGHKLIRVGSASDGGYLAPDDLGEMDYCFSPGVQHISDFEIQLALDHGIKSYLIDGSIDAPVVPEKVASMVAFRKGWIGAFNTGSASGEVPFYSLNSWISEHISPNTRDFILQLDIENAEWEALLAMDMDIQAKARIIVAEFGNLQYITHCREFVWINRVFQKLCQTHDVVHFHPNNCCGKYEYYDGIQIPGLAEITFHRRDRRKLNPPIPKDKISHPLDQDCVPANPSLEVSSWIKYI